MSSLQSKSLAAVHRRASRCDDLESRLARAKRAFSTRRIELPETPALITSAVMPRPGDLVLARVDAIGRHSRLELTTGRRARLHVGDEILVVFGNRYAPDQFEALTPSTLTSCHLVAGGGIAATVVRQSKKGAKATAITPIGIVAEATGERLSTHSFALPSARPGANQPTTIAVFGTAMNAGKTTAMAAMVRAQARAGDRVGTAKVTGTGSGGDLWTYLDAGASVALDFTDAGHASTYRVDVEKLEEIVETLAAHLQQRGVDLILIEISDGLLFEETAALAASSRLRSMVDGVVFAASDSIGALAGDQTLRQHGHDVIAVTGTLTQSPMLAAEAARVIEAPVLTLAELEGGMWRPNLACASQVFVQAG